MKRISVALLVIPSLLAAPPSVDQFLRHPRYATARIRLTNGGSLEGSVTRVTDQFITVRNLGSCDLVPIPDMHKVEWPVSWNGVADDIAVGAVVVLASPVWIPMAVVEAIKSIGRRKEVRPASVFGQWQSDRGTVIRVIGSIAERSEVSATEGRYEFDAQNLVMDGSETYTVNFGCDALTLTGPAGSHNLILNSQDFSASPPVVGEWRTLQPQSDWSLRRDGTWRITRTLTSLRGNCQATDRGLIISWADGTESSLARNGDTLSVTTNGVTEQYRAPER